MWNDLPPSFWRVGALPTVTVPRAVFNEQRAKRCAHPDKPMGDGFPSLRVQELAARRAMVPDPYIEASLADRGILGKSGKLNLPSEITNLYKMEDDGTFTFASTERNKAYLVKPDDAGKAQTSLYHAEEAIIIILWVAWWKRSGRC